MGGDDAGQVLRRTRRAQDIQQALKCSVARGAGQRQATSADHVIGQPQRGGAGALARGCLRF
ncbi:hypothetical protein ANT2_4559 [plant metagenome]|uniref:Uncharacterized protein n=1 Tax=plant metagenome TaxID=1297885 RepID=A0A484RDM6_9ZZZZ